MGMAEDLLLLAVDPRSGRIRMAARIRFSLRSAQLADLILAGLVTITDGWIEIDKKNKETVQPSGDLTPEAIGMIKGVSKRTVGELMKKAPPEVSWDCLASLVQERAILTDDRRARRYPSYFSFQRATAVNQVRRAEILARVDRIVRSEPTGNAAKPLDQALKASAERDRILASLVYASGLDKYLYPGKRGRSARKALAGVVDPQKIADEARSASIATQKQSPVQEQ